MVKTSMFTRNRLQMPLTPGERAFLKILKGFVISAVMAGLTAAWPLLQQQTINWRLVGITGGVALAFTLFTALDKYWTSQGDVALAGLAGAAATAAATAAPSAPATPTQTTPVVANPQPAPVSNI